MTATPIVSPEEKPNHYT